MKHFACADLNEQHPDDSIEDTFTELSAVEIAEEQEVIGYEEQIERHNFKPRYQHHIGAYALRHHTRIHKRNEEYTEPYATIERILTNNLLSYVYIQLFNTHSERKLCSKLHFFRHKTKLTTKKGADITISTPLSNISYDNLSQLKLSS